MVVNFAVLFIIGPALAADIAILYTGETHAMLYPCNCPIEPDGGVARRATLVKQLRKQYPGSLLLDSGAFFAGGTMDQLTQNTQLDMQRSAANLKAMDLMKYDALAIGDEEFNFGVEFLKENTGKTSLNFVSCNMPDLFKPYIIKEVGGLKIGIIGLTAPLAAQKAGGLNFIEPKAAVSKAVEALKKAKVNIILLLSHQGESDDLKLINEVKGIDLLITGHSRAGETPFANQDGTLILRPSWQGRRLGKAIITIEGNKITGYKVEELRLSDKISDDREVASAVPACFQDSHCKKEGMEGVCSDPGGPKSRCVFAPANKVNLTVITSKECVICNPEPLIDFLKKQFTGLEVSYLFYPENKAAGLIRDFGISGLPAYLLGKEADKEKKFNNLRPNLEAKGNYYMLKPQYSGFSYFLGRQKMKGKFDLFISLYSKDADKLISVLREFNPEVHFLAGEQEAKISAPRGIVELEDDLRALCVRKYYPDRFWDYISCRSGNISSSWWDDCIAGMDFNKIKACSKGGEGAALLSENIKLNKELGISQGPAYLLGNREIFSSSGVPDKEELKKLIQR